MALLCLCEDALWRCYKQEQRPGQNGEALAGRGFAGFSAVPGRSACSSADTVAVTMCISIGTDNDRRVSSRLQWPVSKRMLGFGLDWILFAAEDVCL